MSKGKKIIRRRINIEKEINNKEIYNFKGKYYNY